MRITTRTNVNRSRYKIWGKNVLKLNFEAAL
jgi:hypothetical protein